MTLLFVAALAVGAAGCGDDSDGGEGLPDPPATTPAGPGGSQTSTVSPEHQAILDAYHGSVEAMVAAYQAGDPDHPDLTRYFAEGTPAHLNVQNGVKRHDLNDAHYTGEIEVVTASVDEIDEEATPPEATVHACLDDSDFTLVYNDDDSPVPSVEPGGRYTVTATALRGPKDRWYIATLTSNWDTPC